MALVTILDILVVQIDSLYIVTTILDLLVVQMGSLVMMGFEFYVVLLWYAW